MKLVLWPKYLLGGMLQREGGLGGLERGEGGSLVGGLRGIAGRLPDADALLQGGMSEELRNWDLWYVVLVIAHCACKTSKIVLGDTNYFDSGVH